MVFALVAFRLPMTSIVRPNFYDAHLMDDVCHRPGRLVYGVGSDRRDFRRHLAVAS